VAVPEHVPLPVLLSVPEPVPEPVPQSAPKSEPPYADAPGAALGRAAAYWDGVAALTAAVTAWRGESPAIVAADDAEAAWLAPWLPPGGVLIDLGCGEGRLTARLAPRAGQVLAYDLSEGMRAEARRRLAPFPHADVRATDGRTIDAPTGLADLVLVLHVVEHLPPAEAAALCAEAARVLKPSGRAVLHFAADDDAGRAARALHGAPDATRAAACVDEAAVRAFAAAAGMTAILIERAGAAWRVVSVRATRDAARPTAEDCRGSSIPSPGTCPDGA
jgi:SAM-dependent methyltransferase